MGTALLEKQKQKSLVRFCPSQVVFLRDSACQGALEFLKRRPLIVMRVINFTTISNVICITCGASGYMHGINIHLNGINRIKGFADGNDVSQAHPWAVVAVNAMDILVSDVGFIREEEFIPIRDAFEYHMTGRGNRPGYMDELTVEYVNPMPAIYEQREMETQIGQEIRPVSEEPEITDQQKFLSRFQRRDMVNTQVLSTNTVTNTTTSPKGEVVPAKKEYTLVVDKNDRLRELTEEPKIISAPRLTEAAEKILKTLSENEEGMILGRAMTSETIMKVYKCTPSTASILRSYITAQYTSQATVKRILKRVKGNKGNVKFLTIPERVCLSTWIPGAVSGLPEEYLIKLQRQDGVPENKGSRLWEGYRAVRNQILVWFQNKAV